MKNAKEFLSVLCENLRHPRIRLLSSRKKRRLIPDCNQRHTKDQPSLLNPEIHETPGAAEPQPKEKTAKDAKSAKTDFFVSFALFAVEQFGFRCA